MKSPNKLKSKKNKTLRAILVMQMAIIIFLLTITFVHRTFGEKVYIEAFVYDPTDLFRGDYVNIRYGMDSMDASLLDIRGVEKDEYGIVYTEENLQRIEKKLKGKNLYAHLEFDESTGFHQVSKISLDKPSNRQYILIKKYHLSYSYYRNSNGEYVRDQDGNMITESLKIITDNMDATYYLPEGTGHTLGECERKNGNLKAQVAIIAGRPILTNLMESTAKSKDKLLEEQLELQHQQDKFNEELKYIGRTGELSQSKLVKLDINDDGIIGLTDMDYYNSVVNDYELTSLGATFILDGKAILTRAIKEYPYDMDTNEVGSLGQKGHWEVYYQAYSRLLGKYLIISDRLHYNID